MNKQEKTFGKCREWAKLIIIESLLQRIQEVLEGAELLEQLEIIVCGLNPYNFRTGAKTNSK